MHSLTSSGSTRSERTKVWPKLVLFLSSSSWLIVLLHDQVALLNNPSFSVNKNDSTTFESGYRSCVDNVTHEFLPRLISKLNQNQEINALIPLNITTPFPGMDPYYSCYEGLRVKSFRGHRIAFMGDSTLLYLSKHLKAMLLLDDHDTRSNRTDKNNISKTKLIEYDKMRLSSAQNVIQTRGRTYINVKTSIHAKYDNPVDGTAMGWMGLAGFSLTGDSEDLINSMFREGEELKPDIVVTNMGFHWIQLCGHVDKFCPKHAGGVVIQRWLHYRVHWLQRVYDWAVKMKVKVLLFKTLNYICSDVRTGDWATGDAAYKSLDEETIQNCTKRLEPLSGPFILRQTDIYSYCRNGQYTEVGVIYLNDIISKFVKDIQKNEDGSHLTVGLFNDHDVENCDTTVDGIHHRANLMLRGRLLANAIDSYLHCGTSLAEYNS